MPTRYFKATDGTFTVFRATASRVYASAWMVIDRSTERAANDTWVPVGEPHPVNMGFSAKPSAALPAVEITKAEYSALVARKVARTDAEKAANPALWRGYGHSPRDSWVSNEALS
jgi:hypothetical protein